MPILLRVTTVNSRLNEAVITKLNKGAQEKIDSTAFSTWLSQHKIQLTDTCCEEQHRGVIDQLMTFYLRESSSELKDFLDIHAIDFDTCSIVAPIKLNHAPHLISIAGKQGGTVYTGTDTHGCLELLKIIGQQVLANPQDLFIHTGDAVDRGSSSFAIVEYLIQNKDRIICLRGNHEDWALWAIHFLNGIEAVRHRKTDPATFNTIAQTGFHHDLLHGLSDTQLDSLVKKYDALKQDFKCEKSNTGQDLYRNPRYVLKKFNEFYRQPFVSIAEEKIKQFFCQFITTIYNGAEWTMDLVKSQRQTVERFIDELPYGIILTGYYQGEKWVEDPKYFFHAAPLSTNRIEACLSEAEPSLSPDEIAYCTLARPWKPDATLATDERELTAQGRNVYSIEAFVGHNSLSAHILIYAQTNIVDLDMQSFDSNIICIVNLNKRQLCLIKGPGDTFENDESLRAPLARLKEIFNQHRMLIYCYQANAKVVSASRVDINNRLPVGRAANPVWNVAAEHKALLAKAAEGFDPGSRADLKIIKANYIQNLPKKIQELSPEQCDALAIYLLRNPDHPLARERYSTKETYSHETDTMHQAISLLMQRQPPSGLLRVTKSSFSTVATVTLSGNQQFTFTRRVKHFT